MVFKIYLILWGEKTSENREEGKKDKKKKIGRKRNPEQDRIRIYKQSCCVRKSMEERAEVFWRVFVKPREEK